jgi:hypothetical protein
MVVALKKKDRSSLTADYLLKLQKRTTEGMELTFSLMTHASEDQLEEYRNLGLRVEALETRLKKTDLIEGLISGAPLERLSLQPTLLGTLLGTSTNLPCISSF